MDVPNTTLAAFASQLLAWSMPPHWCYAVSQAWFSTKCLLWPQTLDLEGRFFFSKENLYTVPMSNNYVTASGPKSLELWKIPQLTFSFLFISLLYPILQWSFKWLRYMVNLTMDAQGWLFPIGEAEQLLQYSPYRLNTPGRAAVRMKMGPEHNWMLLKHRVQHKTKPPTWRFYPLPVTVFKTVFVTVLLLWFTSHFKVLGRTRALPMPTTWSVWDTPPVIFETGSSHEIRVKKPGGGGAQH